MTKDEAIECAKNMTYQEAIRNTMYAKGIMYKKATRIKLQELAEIADILEKGKNMESTENKELTVTITLDEYRGLIQRVTEERLNREKAELETKLVKARADYKDNAQVIHVMRKQLDEKQNLINEQGDKIDRLERELNETKDELQNMKGERPKGEVEERGAETVKTSISVINR